MSQLHFTSQIGRTKPSTISNQTTSCPFCDTASLENIIDQDGSMILLKNKFPTLQETLQTVLIETDECFGELSKYPKEHLHRLFNFAIRHWQRFEKDPAYKSVILYKNHGPLSGGTIRHPHMQIVAMKEVDYMERIETFHFEGATIYQQEHIDFNISTKPFMGFREFNVNLYDMKDINKMADYIQIAVDYILNHMGYKCESYNLFFYNLGDFISCKIIPRFVASPFFVGYAIPQVADDIEEVAKKIRALYFDFKQIEQ